MTRMMRVLSVAALVAIAVAGGACSSDDDDDVESAAVSENTSEAAAAPADDAAAAPADGSAASYAIDVWADNWMEVFVNGQSIGQDSTPFNTERSFNAERFTFSASAPFTLAIMARDYFETDSGLEYIGEPNQQRGDGGVIAQVTNLDTGEVVASTDSSWKLLVIHRAPLNESCVKDANPDETCESEISDAPSGWSGADFDDAGWSTPTVWSEAEVSPKDGYTQVDWDAAAKLIWGTDLHVDNTVLLRTSVTQ